MGRVDPNFPFAMLFPGSRTEDILLLQTNPQWQSIFDTYGVLPRHPSQLYELLLEGVVLFIILNLYIRKPRPMGAVSGLFLIGYGAFRIIVEFFRQPDAQLPVPGAVHQHGANSFHPDDCRGCDHDGLGISSQPTATRFLRNHETVFRTDAKSARQRRTEKRPYRNRNAFHFWSSDAF
ncbi:prolipoprotein diacylglyceryl transferase family protein [Shigella flexneri]